MKNEINIKKINNCKSGDCTCNFCLKKTVCDRGCVNCKGEHFDCLTLLKNLKHKKGAKNEKL